MTDGIVSSAPVPKHRLIYCHRLPKIISDLVLFLKNVEPCRWKLVPLVEPAIFFFFLNKYRTFVPVSQHLLRLGGNEKRRS